MECPCYFETSFTTVQGWSGEPFPLEPRPVDWFPLVLVLFLILVWREATRRSPR